MARLTFEEQKSHYANQVVAPVLEYLRERNPDIKYVVKIETYGNDDDFGDEITIKSEGMFAKKICTVNIHSSHWKYNSKSTDKKQLPQEKLEQLLEGVKITELYLSRLGQVPLDSFD